MLICQKPSSTLRWNKDEYCPCYPTPESRRFLIYFNTNSSIACMNDFFQSFKLLFLDIAIMDMGYPVFINFLWNDIHRSHLMSLRKKCRNRQSNIACSGYIKLQISHISSFLLSNNQLSNTSYLLWRLLYSGTISFITLTIAISSKVSETSIRRRSFSQAVA